VLTHWYRRHSCSHHLQFLLSARGGTESLSRVTLIPRVARRSFVLCKRTSTAHKSAHHWTPPRAVHSSKVPVCRPLICAFTGTQVPVTLPRRTHACAVHSSEVTMSPLQSIVTLTICACPPTSSPAESLRRGSSEIPSIFLTRKVRYLVQRCDHMSNHDAPSPTTATRTHTHAHTHTHTH
jgi:hypothetical protein